MKKLFVSALAILGLVACAKDDVVSVQDNRSAIGFNTFVENATRVDPSLTNDNIKNFSVWAYMNSADGVVFNDELVTLSGDAWTYTNLQYWLVGNDYTFAAFAGNRAHVTGLPEGAAMFNEGLGEITFTNVEGANDILFAAATVNDAAADQEAVNIQFDHLLSKVKFSFKNGFANPNTTITVEDIKMTAPSTGSVKLDVAAYNTPYVWTRGTEAVTLEFGDMNGLNKLSISEGAKESDDQRLTIPTGADYEYTVTFLVKVYNGTEKGLERPMEVKLSGIEFVAGHAYNLVATINQENLNLNAIEFTVEVDEWVEEDVNADAKVDYSYDSAANIAQVENANGLQEIAAAINEGTIANDATIVLNGDIDLSDITTRSVESNWTPIGTSENPFIGTFDGNGKTIKNMVINGGSQSNIGFFGVTMNGEIKNVTFENAKVSGRLNVGVVAGTPYTSKYTNITVEGHVEVDGMAYVGAVGGKNAYANWTNVTVNVDETSYVNANSVENGTAYRTYVGGVVGFNGEGGHTFSNIYSNINVKGSTCDVGGLFGIAHYGNKFESCVCEGDVEIYAASEEAEAQEIGGIAGVWHPASDVVMNNCSFTGTLKANNDYVIDTYKFGNLVCSAYNTTDKGKLIIDGVAYGANETSKTPVSTADELVAALENNEDVYLVNDINIDPASMSNAYGATGINIKNGQTIDGGGHTLNIQGAGGTWDSGINTTGGIIRNITVTGSFRGIFINHNSTYSEKVVLQGVTITGTVYTISCDQGKYQGIEATNCTFNGWTSFAKTAGEAKFVNCYFGEGSGYKYCRPYSNTEFVGCTFCPGYAVDTTRAEVTFTDCTWEE